MSEKRDSDVESLKDEETSGQGQGQTGGQGPRGGNQAGGMGQDQSESDIGLGHSPDQAQGGLSDMGTGQDPAQGQGGQSDWQKKNGGDETGGTPTA